MLFCHKIVKLYRHTRRQAFGVPMSLCINPDCSDFINSHDVRFCGLCGSELLLQGRYRVERKLGGGGFGKTYELRDNTGQYKVLKVLSDNDPKLVDLFRREAEVLSILNHSGIPKVESDAYFIYFPKNSQKYLHCLVMEKIEGLDLFKYIKGLRNRPIEQKLAIQWLRELTIILQQIHSQNFFHRDIKPSNIMLRTDGRLALIDFGAVRKVTKTYVAKKAAGDVTGIISSGYTPPEQINGQAVQQSDFFALGRTLIYLLTAKDPNHFYEPLANKLQWRDAVPGILPQFADLIDDMIANSVVQRPKNTQIILQRLRDIEGVLAATKSVQNVTKNLVNKVSQAPVKLEHAELWRRLFAHVIDLIILFLFGIVMGFSVASLAGVSSNSNAWNEIVSWGWMGASAGYFIGIFELLHRNLPDLTIISDFSLLIGIIFNWFYFTSFESSVYKGTPGKLIFGIKVTDISQTRISFLQANIRFWAKLISFASLTIGFFIPAFNHKKQGLHDIIAHTILVKNKS